MGRMRDVGAHQPKVLAPVRDARTAHLLGLGPHLGLQHRRRHFAFTATTLPVAGSHGVITYRRFCRQHAGKHKQEQERAQSAQIPF